MPPLEIWGDDWLIHFWGEMKILSTIIGIYMGFIWDKDIS